MIFRRPAESVKGGAVKGEDLSRRPALLKTMSNPAVARMRVTSGIRRVLKAQPSWTFPSKALLALKGLNCQSI